MSRLLRKRIIDLTASGVDWSQGFLRIVRKRATDSSSLFTEGSSTKVRLYSAREAMKMIEATFSKQWILAGYTFEFSNLNKIQILPFSSFAPLATNVYKGEVDVAEGKNCF